MFKNQCFLFRFPSKRQFTLVLLFEIPNGDLLKCQFQKASGKNSNCLKNCPLWFSMSDILWDKSWWLRW